jgi:hypothetical protein
MSETIDRMLAEARKRCVDGGESKSKHQLTWRPDPDYPDEVPVRIEVEDSVGRKRMLRVQPDV